VKFNESLESSVYDNTLEEDDGAHDFKDNEEPLFSEQFKITPIQTIKEDENVQLVSVCRKETKPTMSRAV
jgi:hypothetical protein